MLELGREWRKAAEYKTMSTKAQFLLANNNQSLESLTKGYSGSAIVLRTVIIALQKMCHVAVPMKTGPLTELKDDLNKTGSSETIVKTSFPKPQFL